MRSRPLLIIDGCAARVFPLSLEGSCPGLGDDFSVSRGKVFWNPDGHYPDEAAGMRPQIMEV